MATERHKMLAGQLYNPLDPALVASRQRARDLCRALNQTRESEQEARRRLLCDLFGAGGDTVWMQPPFYCDYGSNIYLGARVFFNFNCVVLDIAKCESETTHFSVQAYRSSHHCIRLMRNCAGSKNMERRWRSRQTSGSMAVC